MERILLRALKSTNSPRMGRVAETSKKHIDKKIYLTKAKVNAAIKSLKPGKAPGENDI